MWYQGDVKVVVGSVIKLAQRWLTHSCQFLSQHYNEWRVNKPFFCTKKNPWNFLVCCVCPQIHDGRAIASIGFSLESTYRGHRFPIGGLTTPGLESNNWQLRFSVRVYLSAAMIFCWRPKYSSAFRFFVTFLDLSFPLVVRLYLA